MDQTPSTNLTPSPTLNPVRLPSLAENEPLQILDELFRGTSTDYDRPPARLEKRASSLSFSPDRTTQHDDETNNILKFFQ